MANEFIARKGLVVLANGAKVTGSLGVMGDVNATGYNVTASNLLLFGSASIDGDLTINGNLTLGNEDVDVVKFLAEVSSSIVPDVNNAFDLGSGSKYWRDLYVSGTAFIDTVQATNVSLDDITVLSDLNVEGNTFLGNGLTDTVIVTGSIIATGSTNLTGPVTITGAVSATSVSGSFSGSGAQITDIPNSGLVNSSLTVTAGSGLSGGGLVSLGGTTTVALDTSSAHFITGSTEAMDLRGVFSSSVQTDVRDTTGIATIATTGSNSFTGVQTITDTTNSTNYTEGALIVQGGVGIARDVNISGSLQVTGLFTAVSMSTQYVTSSQYVIGTSTVIVNSDDLVRFGGLIVVDSGSTAASGSLLWDSYQNHFIYGTDDIHGDSSTPHSAVLIAGPESYGDIGNEIGLVEHRVPVVVSDHNIDSREVSSSIRIDFPSRLTHIEAGLYVTGAVTSSFGFSGDGSNLTGIVTNLNLSGSEGGTGTVSLKTQALTVSGSNGIEVTVSGQTVLISGSNATTTTRGVASFNATNFSVVGGNVTSNNISINGSNVTLGGTRNITLQDVTQYGGTTTTDQVTFNGGAIVHGVLFTSGSNLDIDTGTEVVSTFPTGSYDAAHFDYVVKKNSNLRTGTVMVVWESGTSNVEFTDTSTNDIGDTADVVFTADTLTGNVRLLATVTGIDWAVKTAVRAI